MKAIALVLLSCLSIGLAHGQEQWDLVGDVRVGFLATETRARTGVETDTDSLRARLRAGIRMNTDSGWNLGLRAAGLFDSSQSGTDFWVKGHLPSVTGLNIGQIGIDELYFGYRGQGPWQLRVGRFQAAFPLNDMMKKSLDYNDSPNFDITWTDGIWLQHKAEALTAHLILHHNPGNGPTRTLRPPLGFTDGGSRVGAFAAVAANERRGPVTQRLITVGWLPSALSGIGEGGYLSIAAKSVAEWPVGQHGARFALGAELGYADISDGLAWQTSFNLLDFAPGHSVALVYGRVAEGWLVSGDFRPNESLVELRWVWQITRTWVFDARVRRRDEIDLPATTLMSRRTDDLYLRTTYRFW